MKHQEPTFSEACAGFVLMILVYILTSFILSFE